MVAGFKKQCRNAKLQCTHTFQASAIIFANVLLTKTLKVANQPQIPKAGGIKLHLLMGEVTMSHSKGCAYKMGGIYGLKNLSQYTQKYLLTV